jgi:ribose 5-phosphate isomerase B
MKPKVYIASDHAGFDLKEQFKTKFLAVDWIDLGPTDSSRVDYPDFADRLVHDVVKTRNFGLLICGSGQGMAIRANRHPQIRAALCWNEDIAKLSREHNDCNILCLGSRFTSPELGIKILDVFLKTKFEGGRHSARVDKLGRPITEC